MLRGISLFSILIFGIGMIWVILGGLGLIVGSAKYCIFTIFFMIGLPTIHEVFTIPFLRLWAAKHLLS